MVHQSGKVLSRPPPHRYDAHPAGAADMVQPIRLGKAASGKIAQQGDSTLARFGGDDAESPAGKDRQPPFRGRRIRSHAICHGGDAGDRPGAGGEAPAPLEPSGLQYAVEEQKADENVKHNHPAHGRGIGGKGGIGQPIRPHRRPHQDAGRKAEEPAEAGNPADPRHQEAAGEHQRHEGDDEDVDGQADQVDLLEDQGDDREQAYPGEYAQPDEGYGFAGETPAQPRDGLPGARPFRAFALRRAPEREIDEDDGGEAQLEADVHRGGRIGQGQEKGGGAERVQHVAPPAPGDSPEVDDSHQGGAARRHLTAGEAQVEEGQDQAGDSPPPARPADPARKPPQEADHQPDVQPGNGQDMPDADAAEGALQVLAQVVPVAVEHRGEHGAVGAAVPQGQDYRPGADDIDETARPGEQRHVVHRRHRVTFAPLVPPPAGGGHGKGSGQPVPLEPETEVEGSGKGRRPDRLPAHPGMQQIPPAEIRSGRPRQPHRHGIDSPAVHAEQKGGDEPAAVLVLVAARRLQGLQCRIEPHLVRQAGRIQPRPPHALPHGSDQEKRQAGDEDEAVQPPPRHKARDRHEVFRIAFGKVEGSGTGKGFRSEDEPRRQGENRQPANRNPAVQPRFEPGRHGAGHDGDGEGEHGTAGQHGRSDCCQAAGEHLSLPLAILVIPSAASDLPYTSVRRGKLAILLSSEPRYKGDSSLRSE